MLLCRWHNASSWLPCAYNFFTEFLSAKDIFDGMDSDDREQLFLEVSGSVSDLMVDRGFYRMALDMRRNEFKVARQLDIKSQEHPDGICKPRTLSSLDDLALAFRKMVRPCGWFE